MTEGDDESAPPLVLKKPLTEEERKVDTTFSLCKYFQQLVCFFVLKDQELQIDRFKILKYPAWIQKMDFSFSFVLKFLVQSNPGFRSNFTIVQF